jgi:PAS domain S-box-containing protein
MVEVIQTRQELLDKLCEVAGELKVLEEQTLTHVNDLEQYRVLFEDLFQNPREGIVLLYDWTILLANSKICEMLGVPHDQLIGANAKRLIPLISIEEAVESYELRVSGQIPRGILRQKMLKADGTELEVEIDAASVSYAGKGCILAVISDITLLVRTEQELISLRQYQVSLVEHVNIWVDVLDKDGNITIWNRAAEEISGYPASEVIGNKKVWDYLFPDPDYRQVILTTALNVTKSQGEVRGFETTIVTRDHQTRVMSWYLRSFLDASGEAIGAIAIGLDITDVRQANQEIEKSHQALSAAYDETIEGWSRALDLRDKETKGHSQRVTDMTEELAKLAGISGIELVYMKWGALLHDIGKLAIPDSILFKTAKLTKAEWAEMKKHTEYAYTLLYPIVHLRPAIDIPLYHHEKWDGSGYPNGLQGEEIPRCARLFAVADIWDAVRADRPYRKAWGEKKALDYIKSLAGTALDPQTVAYFLELHSRT